MDIDRIRRLAELVERPVDLPQGSGESPELEPELRAQLELCLVRALIERGALHEAAEILVEASGRTRPGWQRETLVACAADLARVASRAARNADAGGLAEQALRTAASVAPAQAGPLLARSLEQRGLVLEAISRWEELIGLHPTDSRAYLALSRLHEREGRPDRALALCLELIGAAPSHMNYLMVAERIGELLPALSQADPRHSIRIALLGNATLAHLHRYLLVDGYAAGLRPDIYECGFDQYFQEILDPRSALYSHQPDVIVLAIHASRLFPAIYRYPFDVPIDARHREIDAGIDTLAGLLDTLRQRSAAMVLVHNMVVPQHPSIGILDTRDELGEGALFAEINRRLAELLRTRYENIYLVDEDRLQARCGKKQATDPRLWLTARLPWSGSALRELSAEYLRFLQALTGTARKCVVLDLDNTLWGGVAGEDGTAGIEIGPDAPGNAYIAFQRELETLWKRGILLAICSKNNPEDALAVFEQRPEMILKLSHFAACRMNWDPKPANLAAIAAELNLGLDSLVFLDDNPVERATVRAALPQVLVPELPTDPSGYREVLLELGVFDGLTFTEEDKERNRLYAEEKARRALEVQCKTNGSLEDYLAALQIRVHIEAADSTSMPRIAQLTNKTNQFNLTTRRYTEAQLTELQRAGWRVYGLRASDRFGDNGLVGVVVVDPSIAAAWTIDTLLLSCRVMGRGVESALLAVVAEEARRAGAEELRGWYRPTSKNAPAGDCYERHGFQCAYQEPDGATVWALDLRRAMIAVPSWLEVRTLELAVTR